ncbi:hypothetical protein BDW72DRAFT_210251 [Aspergillus terricola var. indicus]
MPINQHYDQARTSFPTQLPPPPPPPENPNLKASPFTRRIKTVPRPDFFQSRSTSALAAAPLGVYLFYGTLADTALLAEILSLDSVPQLRPARILGYKVKLWGQYPAVIPVDEAHLGTNSDCFVEGFAYRLERVQHAERLAEYETGNYRPGACQIVYSDDPTDELKDKAVEEQGYVFQFVGDMNDLSEGVFDLGTWLKLIGRGATVGSKSSE